MSDLWSIASRDAEDEALESHLAVARSAAAPLWPHLAAATSMVDYENRKALIADKIERVAAAVAEGDPARFGVAHTAIIAEFDQDFTVLHEARTAARKQATFMDYSTGEIVSDACGPRGDGQCDGIIPPDEANGNGDCSCGCHTMWDPLSTTQEYAQWHRDYWTSQDFRAKHLTAARKTATDFNQSSTIRADQVQVGDSVNYGQGINDWGPVSSIAPSAGNGQVTLMIGPSSYTLDASTPINIAGRTASRKTAADDISVGDLVFPKGNPVDTYTVVSVNGTQAILASTQGVGFDPSGPVFLPAFSKVSSRRTASEPNHWQKGYLDGSADAGKKRPKKDTSGEHQAYTHGYGVGYDKYKTSARKQADDQNGDAVSALPQVEVSTSDQTPAFSGGWASADTGKGAADVADVPTPGGEAGYPQPTASRHTAAAAWAQGANGTWTRDEGDYVLYAGNLTALEGEEDIQGDVFGWLVDGGLGASRDGSLPLGATVDDAKAAAEAAYTSLTGRTARLASLTALASLDGQAKVEGVVVNTRTARRLLSLHASLTPANRAGFHQASLGDLIAFTRQADATMDPNTDDEERPTPNPENVAYDPKNDPAFTVGTPVRVSGSRTGR